jgi:hypothetical protein
MSVQFLRGDLGADQRMNFGTLYNAFLAVYQVFSSENWTDVLYDTAGAEMPFGQGVITVLFISGWMLFANCTCLFCPSSPFPFHCYCMLTKRTAISHRAADVHRRHQRELQRRGGGQAGDEQLVRVPPGGLAPETESLSVDPRKRHRDQGPPREPRAPYADEPRAGLCCAACERGFDRRGAYSWCLCTDG